MGRETRFRLGAGFVLLATLFLSVPSVQAGLIGQPAPELTNEVWINSMPLRLADLRGKVVLVEFWTYG